MLARPREAQCQRPHETEDPELAEKLRNAATTTEVIQRTGFYPEFDLSIDPALWGSNSKAT